MCLRVKGRKLEQKVADKDIVCYKIATYDTICGRNYLRSYFMGEIINLGRKYELYGDIEYKKKGRLFHPTCEVSEGVYHLFKSKEDAESYIESSYRGCVLEAVIPAGAKYAEGMFNGECESYVSKEVTYTRILGPQKIARAYAYNDLKAKRLSKEEIIQAISDLDDIIAREAGCEMVSMAEAQKELYQCLLSNIEAEEVARELIKSPSLWPYVM